MSQRATSIPSTITANVSRRTFVQGGLVTTGGLVLGISLTGCKPGTEAPRELKQITTNAWLRIGTDESITFLCDRSEMGQGVFTALPMLLAEELGVAVERIKVEFAPAGAAYVNNLLGGQITGGSASIRDAWDKLRTAGAQARTMLVATAAEQLKTQPETCRVEDGVIVSSHGKRLSYGAVAEAAAARPALGTVKLKPSSEFKVIGKPQARLDTPAKVDGSTVYGIDVQLPGMVHGALAQSPVLLGTVKSYDDTKAKAMPGVLAVVQTSSGIVVLADSWWRAKQARDALEIVWDGGRNATLNDVAILRGLRRAASGTAQVARTEGDVAAALKNAARVVRADYELPLLAHATLEPQNCTAHVTADGCDLYVPTQVQQIAQAAAATAAGLTLDQVRVHTTFLGGGFGRRLEVDFIPAAVEASKAVGKPVKLLWTREDDITHDAYRPPAFDQCAAGFDQDGKLIAWHLHLTGPSITARMFPSVVENSIDPFAIEAAANYPYDVPNVLVEYVPAEIGIHVGYWRSVSHALNCFVAESFMDELAAAARKDPVQFRTELLAKQPRYLDVLKTVAREARYGRAPKGRFQGVALMEGYGTYMAQVAEISLEDGKVRVHQITCAADCGQVVNPGIVAAQIESSIVFGLSAALWGEINIAGGRVQQTNFDRYRIARLPEVPKISTYVLPSEEAPGGIGEPATALVAPAICNALVAATGKRVRSLPLSKHKLA
ncbi:MAG TPA: molybdopterin-dependent oxidoreductase [Steroidobacteraceae bacterium]|nr:molybdopterin-dependent oxidoreductase [Steroidobacteraceae bacterium]HRX88130.1 molybdopterin-dependent oxidoreductase [Steroidobacteraceae bacterium]